MLTALALAAPLCAQADWRLIPLTDEFNERTGRTAVGARVLAPVARECAIYIHNRSSVQLVCRYFNLVGGKRDRYRDGRLFDITMKIGGETFTEQLEEDRSMSGGYFDSSSMVSRILKAAAENPEGRLPVSLSYYREGQVVLDFPLKGLHTAAQQSTGLKP